MLVFRRVDKKMVKKARQQEKQGTAPNSQTFQVKLVKALQLGWMSTKSRYFAVFLKSNNPGAQKC